MKDTLFIFDFDRTIAETEALKQAAQKAILTPFPDGNIRFPNVEQPGNSILYIAKCALENYLEREATLQEIEDAIQRWNMSIIDLLHTDGSKYIELGLEYLKYRI